jgi:hypothetical protein
MVEFRSRRLEDRSRVLVGRDSCTMAWLPDQAAICTYEETGALFSPLLEFDNKVAEIPAIAGKIEVMRMSCSH